MIPPKATTADTITHTSGSATPKVFPHYMEIIGKMNNLIIWKDKSSSIPKAVFPNRDGGLDLSWIKSS